MLKNISKGQSSIPLRYLIAGLEQDFSQIRHSIRLMYIDSKDSTTVFYYKAPSSTFPSLMYDVVIEYHASKLVKADSETLFKVYCNSPSFYFRYANTFKNNGSLLFNEKYPPLVEDEAKVRNPTQVTGFDKYVYSCLRLSMTDTVENLKKKQYQNTIPNVDSFNQKRFEYIKLQKLKKVAEDGIVL